MTILSVCITFYLCGVYASWRLMRLIKILNNLEVVIIPIYLLSWLGFIAVLQVEEEINN